MKGDHLDRARESVYAGNATHGIAHALLDIAESLRIVVGTSNQTNIPIANTEVSNALL